MPDITIAGTPISFPDSGTSPDWAPAVIEFAEAVADALSGLVTAGDIPKQAFQLTGAHNPASNVSITNLAFSTSAVRAAFIRYSVYRNTTTTTLSEAGTLTIVYNPTNSSTQKWDVSRVYVGDASIAFSVTDAGQVQFTTSTMGGVSHTGDIQFTAQVLPQE